MWWGLLLLPSRGRGGVVGLVLLVYVVASRLEPFDFSAYGKPFGWIPFRSLMRGSLQVDARAFLEKFFLYGCVIFLLGNAAGRRWLAAGMVTVLLFATSWAETYLAGRSGEITDALMAAMIAAVFAVMPDPSAEGEAPRPSTTANERRLRDWQRAQARALGVKLDR